jgi:hypothetical protein
MRRLIVNEFMSQPRTRTPLPAPPPMGRRRICPPRPRPRSSGQDRRPPLRPHDPRRAVRAPGRCAGRWHAPCGRPPAPRSRTGSTRRTRSAPQGDRTPAPSDVIARAHSAAAETTSAEALASGPAVLVLGEHLSDHMPRVRRQRGVRVLVVGKLYQRKGQGPAATPGPRRVVYLEGGAEDVSDVADRIDVVSGARPPASHAVSLRARDRHITEPGVCTRVSGAARTVASAPVVVPHRTAAPRPRSVLRGGRANDSDSAMPVARERALVLRGARV